MDQEQEIQSDSVSERTMQQDNSGGAAIAGNGSSRATTSEQQQLDWAPLVLTEQKIQYLWEQISKFPQVFDDFSKGNYREFASQFFNRTNVFIDIGPDLGLAAGFNVRPGLDAVLHLVMFDRRLRGREVLFKDIMRYYFRVFNLRRMTAAIAADCVPGIKLIERLGFKHEGTMRHAVLRDGRYHDWKFYGMLREELDSPRPERRRGTDNSNVVTLHPGSPAGAESDVQ